MRYSMHGAILESKKGRKEGRKEEEKKKNSSSEQYHSLFTFEIFALFAALREVFRRFIRE